MDGAMRLVAWCVTVAVGCLVALSLHAGTASADITDCNPNGQGGHSYGNGCLAGDLFTGISGQIRSNKLDLSDPDTDFANNDMWIVNNASTPVHWIEAGIVKGRFCTHIPEGSSQCDHWFSADQNRRYFWADSRQGDGYNGHVDTNDVPPLSTYISDSIARTSSTTWAVHVGQINDTSTSNPLTPNFIRAGTEVTTNNLSASYTVCNAAEGLNWRDSNNVWHPGWNDASNDPHIGASNPPHAMWQDPTGMPNHTWVRSWDYTGHDEADCYTS
jgi:hypothetical protein